MYARATFPHPAAGINLLRRWGALAEVSILGVGLLTFILIPWTERLTVLYSITDRDNPTFITVAPQMQRAFVLNQGSRKVSKYVATFGFASPGTISVIDTRKGGVLRTIGAGNDPHMAVVDEQAGRVYVVNSMLH